MTSINDFIKESYLIFSDIDKPNAKEMVGSSEERLSREPLCFEHKACYDHYKSQSKETLINNFPNVEYGGVLYLAPQGFRYFLPAFMDFFINNESEDSPFHSSFAFRLLELQGESGSDYLEALRPNEAEILHEFIDEHFDRLSDLYPGRDYEEVLDLIEQRFPFLVDNNLPPND